MKRIAKMQEREREKKERRRLAAEYARLTRALRVESPKFRKMMDIKKELKL